MGFAEALSRLFAAGLSPLFDDRMNQ